MSHQINDVFLEQQRQLAEEAVVANDADGLASVYLTLEENGFTTEAEALKEDFGILSV